MPAAFMERGHVTVCTSLAEAVDEESGSGGCPALSLYHKVILGYGQETELGGIRCVSATEGIICTAVSGAGAGKGFRINRAQVVQVG